MKKIYSLLPILILATQIFAQSLSTTSISTSGNAFTVINPRMNNIVYNEDIDALIFGHRTDQALFPLDDGNHANFRYDLSTNYGTSFTTNLPNRDGGLNPSASNAGCRATRFPQVSIYNPSGNTNINNAYMVYLGSYHDGGNCGGICANGLGDGIWEGIVSGVVRLDGDTSTITENYTPINGGDVSVTNSLIQSKPGTFYAVVPRVECNTTDSGITVLRGDWDDVNKDVNWTVAQQLPLDMEPTLSATSPIHKFVETIEIAFDPSGRYGWIAAVADLNINGIQVFDPVFYHTQDSGLTWNGPITLDLDTILGKIESTNFPSTDWTARVNDALVVDANGMPHLALNAYPNTLGAYPVYVSANGWMNEMFLYHLRLDSVNNSCNTWTMKFIDSIHTVPGVLRGTTAPNIIEQSLHTHAVRSADGTKIFFGWTDTDQSVAPINENVAPDLKMIGYDLTTNLYTTVKNWTSADPTFQQAALYPAMSTIANETSPGTWNIPTVLGTMSPFAAYDDPISFDFITNITYTGADFTEGGDGFGPTQTLIGPNPIFLNVGQSFIDPGVSVEDCTDNIGSISTSSNSNVNTSIKGTYSVNYIATDPAGNSDTITRTVIIGLQSLLTASNTSTCTGDSIVVSAQAFGATGSVTYLWSSSSNMFHSTSADSAVYVVLANNPGQIQVIIIDGGSGLRDTNSVSISQGFDVNIAQGDTVFGTLFCNTVAVLDAQFSGDTIGKFFQWSNTSLNHQISVNDGIYWVTAQAQGGCQVADTTTVITNALNQPSFVAPGVICQNKSVTFTNTSQKLTATGWTATWRVNGNIFGTGDVFNFTFPAATTYNVTLDVDSSTCNYSTNQVINVTSAAVSPCNSPLVISVSGSTNICTGDTASLSVSVTGKPGPFSYFWTPSSFIDNSNSATPKIYPPSTQTNNLLVTDGIDSNSTTVVIVVNSRPNPGLTVTPDTIRCDGGSITISAPGSFNSYNWSNGTNGVALIQTTTSGQYYVLVDDGVCTGYSDTVNIGVSNGPATPTISLSPIGTVCSPDSITLSVPASNSDYQWSNGATGTNSIKVGTNGSYNVTVFDQLGCPSTAPDVNVYITDVVTNNLDICAVQYLGTSNNTIIVWDTTGHRGIEFYQVQHASDSTGPFSTVGTVSSGDAPIVEDVNTSSSNSNYYRIQAIDSCGNLIASGTSAYNSINLSVNRISSDSVELNWNGFTGFNNSVYRIFSGTSPTNLNLLTVITAPQTSYIDLSASSTNANYYQIVVSGPLTCSADTATYSTVRSNIFVLNAISIGGISWQHEIELYPNPTSGAFNLVVPESFVNNTKYLITDITGKRITKTREISQKKIHIELDDLASGTYFIKIQGVATITKKIVVRR